MMAERHSYPFNEPAPRGSPPGRSGASCSRGFTLLELLTVVSITGVLAAIILACAGGALRRVRMIECLSNMRQMGAAVQMFAGDHDGVLPGTSHGVSWTNSLAEYLGPGFIGRCPAQLQHRSRVTYGWNDCLATNGTGMPIGQCRKPGLTMAVAEIAASQSSEHLHFAGTRGGAARLTPNQFRAEVNVEAHGTSANYLFVDGHSENVEWTEVQNRITQTDTVFVVP